MPFADLVAFTGIAASSPAVTPIQLQRAMGLVASGGTILLIARRLQTARALYRILVVDNGLIVEGGSHEELLALRGRYADLWAAMVYHLAGSARGRYSWYRRRHPTASPR